MSDYKEIVGTRVKAVSANPDNPTVGQVWYNSTDEALKYRKANERRRDRINILRLILKIFLTLLKLKIFFVFNSGRIY